MATNGFALFFVLILPNYLDVSISHKSLYDTSNKDRFTAFLYALQVIYYKKLFLQGLLPSVNYQNIILSSAFKINVFPHNSFLSIILCYSLMFGGLYFISISKWMRKNYCLTVRNGALLFAYVITSQILHDMFIGSRFFAFFIFMTIPLRSKKIRLGMFR